MIKRKKIKKIIEYKVFFVFLHLHSSSLRCMHDILVNTSIDYYLRSPEKPGNFYIGIRTHTNSG